MSTIIIQTSEDTHELANNTSYADGTTLRCEAALLDTARWLAGMRFSNAQLPNDVLVTAAYMRVVFPVVQRDSPDLYWRGEAVADAVSFTTNPDVALRARTTAEALWQGTNLGYGSFVDGPSLVAIITEIQAIEGFGRTSAIVLFADGDSVVAQEDGCRLTPSNLTPANACILHIEYDPDAPPPLPPKPEPEPVPAISPLRHRLFTWKHPKRLRR